MRRVFLMALAACLLTASAAFAEVKIGVVDMQVVATQSEPAKDAQTKMKSKYGAASTWYEKTGGHGVIGRYKARDGASWSTLR